VNKSYFPEKWIVRKAENVFSQVPTSIKKVKSKECKSFGKFPVIDQGRSAISGYIDDAQRVINVIEPLVIFGDHTRILKWICNDFVPGADGTKVLQSKPFLDPKYFYYHLRAIEIPDKGYARHFKYLKESDFGIAPYAEQRKIVIVLDKLLVKADTIKTRIDVILSILKRFRQSVLTSAVTGKLTKEWREKNPNIMDGLTILDKWLKERREKFEIRKNKLIADGNQKYAKKFREPVPPDLETTVIEYPNNWATVSVSQFAECLDQIRVPVKKAYRSSTKGLYPYFGANGEVDRVDEYLFDDDLVMVTEDETFYGRTKPISYRYTGKCWVNNHAHVLRAPTRDANDFLCYSLMYYNVIPWLSGTTGRAKLTQAAMNSLPIGLPPIEEQTEIVNCVEKLFSFADQIEQRVLDAQKRVNSLSHSILAKAFRGELTAEWREQNPDLVSGENSAAALLEKIKSEREATQENKSNKKKKSRKKTAA